MGTSILSISETAGLGMRAKTDPAFLAQFNGASVDKFTVVKMEQEVHQRIRLMQSAVLQLHLRLLQKVSIQHLLYLKN